MLQHPFKRVTELSKVIWAEIIEETENQPDWADSANGLGDGEGWQEVCSSPASYQGTIKKII